MIFINQALSGVVLLCFYLTLRHFFKIYTS